MAASKKLETLDDAERHLKKIMSEPGAAKQLDDDLVKARLFAADLMTQARENNLDGGTMVGAACYFLAGALASTTTSDHMSEPVRQMIFENAIQMTRDCFADMRRFAEKKGY